MNLKLLPLTSVATLNFSENHWLARLAAVILTAMPTYPIYLNLCNKKALVVGAGQVAARKAQALSRAGASILVVAREYSAEFNDICKHIQLERIEGDYSPEYLDDATLAIAATDDSELNTRIYNDCRARNVLCNVVDVPHLCDFYVPAVINHGDLTISIGTSGKCPAYAGRLRRKLESIITPDHGAFLEVLESARQKVITSDLTAQQRKKLLHHLAADTSFTLFRQQGADAWLKWADQQISASR
ncbi:Siroheme synthase [Anaerohalosphaera lusitana]|uniref:precorrin-2 dehydrogenase n=1 Tax=Anaerohalosphaera lusitana TaxID=1936003 RepID=A0A1U9NKS3_9BACT|nr:bifunctional precorrin-2 dehydrogenase/sirohydrochlorin ferrochelatase [Anaerohalosphaera lusitana]AQT68509.1 Siroheme synthase [Anaerohalosphaera lusitana]